MYRYLEKCGNRVCADEIMESLISAKTKMWRNISAKIELGVIDDKHIVYEVDTLHVSCDNWFWSVDVA